MPDTTILVTSQLGTHDSVLGLSQSLGTDDALGSRRSLRPLVWDPVAGDLVQTNCESDNIALAFGDDRDARAFYDGTDLVLDPDVVGSGVVLIDGGLYVEDAAELNSTLSVAGASVLSGNIAAGGTLSVVSATTLLGTLDVTGLASFAGGTQIDGEHRVQDDYTNGNASAITIGQIVYLESASTVDLAQADDAATAQAFGIVVEDPSIAASATGAIRTAGTVSLTTGQWDAVTGETGGLTAGAVYYLSPTTAGGLTQTKPTSVEHFATQVGVAVNSTRLELQGFRVEPNRNLSSDLTIHVDTAGDDATGTGSASAPYATLNRAVRHYSDLNPGTNTITVQFADGIYTFTESYKPAYPYAAALTFKGSNTNHGSGISLSNFDTSYSTDASFANLQYFDMDVTLTGATVTVGEFLRLTSSTGGTNPQACNGFHKIIAWNSGTEVATVRVWSTVGVSALPSGSITATAIQYHTILKFDISSGAAIEVTGNSADSGAFESLVIEGNDADSYNGAVGVQSNSGGGFRCSDVGVHGWLVGAQVNAASIGTFNGSYVSKSKNQAVQVFNSRFESTAAIINGSGFRALLAQTGSSVRLQNAWCVGSANDYCIRADQSNVQCFGLNAYYGDSSSTGILAQLGSHVDARSRTLSGFTTNTATATSGEIFS